MKKVLLLLFCIFSLFTSCASYDKNVAIPGNNSNPDSTGGKIKIGTSTFTATLYDNAAAAAFKTLLPMTIDMVELNGKKKYVDLSRSLPTNTFNLGTIQTGDLMPYSSSTLVLFYKTFSSSYSYTKLGRIDDVTGLAAAVGSGNVTIMFELE